MLRSLRTLVRRSSVRTFADDGDAKVKDKYGIPDDYPTWRKTWQERDDSYKPRYIWQVFTRAKGPSRYFEMISGSESFKNHLRNAWRRAKELDSRLDQSFKQERHDHLGPDLAVVHFVAHRGGAVRLHGRQDWITVDADNKLPPYVPDVFAEGYFVQGVDCEHFFKGALRYEGVRHLAGLRFLAWLSVKNNPLFDDWCLDLVAGASHASLRHLDVSGSGVTPLGLVAAYKFDGLQTLIVGKDAPEGTELACLELQAVNPGLKVEFV